MKTALTSTKLAIAAFIVPYVFALSPEMLFVGETTVWNVILICLSAIVGISAVSAALEGYLLCKMRWYERILSAAGGLLLIVPGLVTDSIGLGLVALVVVLQLFEKKKANKTAAA